MDLINSQVSQLLQFLIFQLPLIDVVGRVSGKSNELWLLSTNFNGRWHSRVGKDRLQMRYFPFRHIVSSASALSCIRRLRPVKIHLAVADRRLLSGRIFINNRRCLAVVSVGRLFSTVRPAGQLV